MTATPGRIVLLVEDDPGLRELLILELGLAGYRVRPFASAEQALSRCRDRSDLAVLDYRLPGLDGLNLLVRLRRRQPHLPALIISSDCRHHQLGCDPLTRLLRKPFSLQGLLDSVHGLMPPQDTAVAAKEIHSGQTPALSSASEHPSVRIRRKL